ncbi:uncharacterized protein LOC125238265 [Leguminivora glycinivorella]|uniref:uncharacterized protein LOC125238265 n=1 Tax=Leguminivora glycinivorella TaxID=1035111 RepID=UPI00200DA19B|nr:uncharacterized protein LOC125238265 [Leguminivora glycinivorella]
MAATSMSTPINRITRDNLTVLIRNNVLDDSVEFMSDNDMMETDSPVRTVRSKNLQPISKKLFHSPMQNTEDENQVTRSPETRRRHRKRKQLLIPDGGERFKKAYIQCEEGFSENLGGMRKKVLISLFHNKEYSMDVGI